MRHKRRGKSMEKRLFDFNIKTIAAIVGGVVLITFMFMYMKIPSGIPETEIQIASGVGAFLAAIFGPVAGGVIAFAGHAVSDTIQSGSPWWSWVIASGVSGFLIGMVYPKLKLELREFEKHDLIKFNLFQIVGNGFAWIIVAPILDIVLYHEPVKLVFKQGLVAGMANMLSTGLVGALLLLLYVEIRSRWRITKKHSFKQD